MKKIINKLLLTALCSSVLCPINGLELVTGDIQNKPAIRVELGDDKKTELESFKKRLEELTKEKTQAQTELKIRLDKITADITLVDSILLSSQNFQPFLLKKQALLKNIKQIYSDIETEWQDILNRVQQHLLVLEAYVKDPQHGALKFEKKSFHLLSDLQELNDRIVTQEEKVRSIAAEKNEAILGLSHCKKKLTETEKTSKEKQKEQEKFIRKGENDFTDSEDLTFKERGELLDLQVVFSRYAYQYAQLCVRGEEIKLDSIATRINIEEKRLSELQKRRDSISRISLRVDEKDVEAANRLVQEKQNKHFENMTIYDNELSVFKNEYKKLKEEFQTFIEENKTNVTDINALAEWTARPTTSQEYKIFGELGYRKEALEFLDKNIDLTKAHIDFEKSEFAGHKIEAEIIQSWYKIKHQRFLTNEELLAEIKSYEDHNTLLQREYSVFEDKRRATTRKLTSQNEALHTIKDIQTKMASQRALFSSSAEYSRTLHYLNEARDLLSKQITLTSKLIEIYSKLLVTIEHSLRHVKTMDQELNRVRLWHRSGGAISKEGIINLLPDIKAFMSDVRILGLSYLANFTIASLFKTVKGLATDPFSSVFFLIQFLFIFLIYILLNRYLKKISDFLLMVSPEIRGTFVASRVGAFLIIFIHKHLRSLFLWFIFFIFLGFIPLLDLYPGILFYLFSIPYLLYIAHQLVRYFGEFNQEHDSVFFNENFQERFVIFMSLFLYSSIIILFFREAFILATYTKSELPDILLALYSMIGRVLLLSLVRKEDLLNFISTKTVFWASIWRLIDNYYYPVLLSFVLIMVMTDPHIGGYNNLVSYLIWGTIGSIIIAKMVFEFYVFIRRSVGVVFFSSDGEVLKERFTFAKVSYGLSVIFLFFLFTLIGGLLVAWVWGSPIPLESVVDFFNAERLTIALGEGQFQKLSIFEVIKSFSFIPLGFIVAFAIEKLVLHRIFSVLLVNPGVHNAISTISYYVIIIIVVTMGLWAQGFKFLIAYLITPILFGIVWSLKEVFNDFVAYFIILVQRPLKVGDYIKMDPETCGVVRSISPRAVVLRRKKGFCIIVPNSRVIRETIVNWDYNLNFISLPDILINIEYAADPTFTKKVLETAVGLSNQVLKSPPPIIRLDNFGEYGYEFMIRCFVGPEKTLEQWCIAGDVRLLIVKELSKHGIKIAFPVRVIRLSKEDRGKLFNIDHSHDHEISKKTIQNEDEEEKSGIQPFDIEEGSE
ncbi:mechanosensitive ion channel [Candidatus Babeliales bacterium]|nr:mechanosensitive ion channel [Candidatus Babeliales bacterium]